MKNYQKFVFVLFAFIFILNNAFAQNLQLEANIRIVKDSKTQVKDVMKYDIKMKFAKDGSLKKVSFDHDLTVEGDFTYEDLTKIGVNERKDDIKVEVFDTDVTDNTADVLMILYEKGEVKGVCITTVNGITLQYLKGEAKPKKKLYVNTYRT